MGVGEDVRLCIRVADKIVKAAAVEGERVELLDGNASLVFDDALQPAVDIPHTGDDASTKFVLCPDDELIRVFHAHAGLERLEAADANIHGSANASSGIVAQQVLRIGDEEGAKIGRAV